MPIDTPETAPAAPAAAVATPETPVTPTEPVAASAPTQPEIPEGYEYNGDRNSVPEPLKKHVAGIDRYWTKKSQAFAETEKKAREHEALVNSPEYKAFQQFKATGAKPANPEPVTTTQEDVTDEEMDAIALGDKTVLKSVIARGIKAALDPATGALKQQVDGMAAKQKEVETAEMIKAFSEAKPDFWNIWDSYEPHMKLALEQGMPLEKAYEAFKDIEAKADTRADERYKAQIEAKKQGSAAASTITGTPDVVYAEDENDAKRIAIQLTLKGDKRQVQIKKT
jgi:hypothetical protein